MTTNKTRKTLNRRHHREWPTFAVLNKVKILHIFLKVHTELIFQQESPLSQLSLTASLSDSY